MADVRQCGFIAGIELRDGESPAASSHLAAQVCLAARQHGLLTRPIRHVIVLMPPFCIEPVQLTAAVDAIERSLHELCAARPA